jgi:hypothetical protein
MVGVSGLLPEPSPALIAVKTPSILSEKKAKIDPKDSKAMAAIAIAPHGTLNFLPQKAMCSF